MDKPEKNGKNRRNIHISKEDKRRKDWLAAKSAERTRIRKKFNKSNMDYTLLFIIILLILFGIMMVYSSSYYIAAIKNNDSMYFLKRQAMYAVAGLCGMYIMSKFYYKYFNTRVVWFIYVISAVLVLYASLFGVKTNGAARWINVFGITVQPSEFAKVAIILLVPYLITHKPHLLKNIWGHILILVPVLLMTGLVANENMSTAIIIAIIGFGILFVASPRTGLFIIMGIAGITLVVGYLYLSSKFGSGFRGGRFKAWLHPFDYPKKEGYQIIQSLYAVASGGIFGLGLGNSRQKLNFIPEPQNDIIFAIICEELGFFGAAVLLTMFAVVIWRGFKISLKCPELFGSLVAAGITIMFATQVVINVAVATNSIPNTGIALPFISSGGTALVVCAGLTGILLNISRSDTNL